MSQTHPIIPHLPYEDRNAAVEWLANAFGFREREVERIAGADGTIVHTAMEVGIGGRVMLGTPGGHGAFPPRKIGGVSQLLSVYVEDADAHCERARAAGAKIVVEPVDKFWGDRVYEVEDLEGHRWAFHQRVRDVPPEEWDWEPASG